MSAEVFSEAMGLIGEKYIMEAATYQRKKQTATKVWLSRVAGVLLAILLAGSAVLAFSAEARAAVLGWVRQQIESLYAYVFVGDPVAADPVRYELSEIPEGFTLATVYEIDGGELYIYTNEETGIIGAFSYSINPSESSSIVLEGGVCEHRKVTVNGMPGDLYLPTDGSERSELLWMDDTTGTIFSLSFPFDEDTMLKIAESIEIVD